MWNSRTHRHMAICRLLARTLIFVLNCGSSLPTICNTNPWRPCNCSKSCAGRCCLELGHCLAPGGCLLRGRNLLSGAGLRAQHFSNDFISFNVFPSVCHTPYSFFSMNCVCGIKLSSFVLLGSATVQQVLLHDLLLCTVVAPHQLP